MNLKASHNKKNTKNAMSSFEKELCLAFNCDWVEHSYRKMVRI